MYKIGQTLNIGYYGGFKHRNLIKSKAKIVNISGNFITIIIDLPHGGFKKMFGYDYQLKEMENIYKQNI